MTKLCVVEFVQSTSQCHTFTAGYVVRKNRPVPLTLHNVRQEDSTI
ncbi:hypothetical protein [Coleofasciculus sp. FACHB-SPT9]|nr:hypothetical protein [Coleofasciculus sp. FACHB-SPT9]MBD1891354.1 hypothetical protein [Coleofasciculus sp. FACHB-SPT9]